MRTLVAITLAVGVAGCATVDLPSSDPDPRQTIAAAEERGVEDNPDAKLHLQMAKDAVEEAEYFIEENDDRDAKLSLMRAEADAELALAMVRLDAAREEVREVQSKIDELQSDLEATQ